jgi:nitrite reductase/ring-hydroxylating ferredoxin subunit
VGLEQRFQLANRNERMTEYFQVAKASDIPSGERKRIELNGERISIFNIDGEFFAIYDQCPHKKTAPLFDLKTGECDRGERFNTRVYLVKVVDDDILVGTSASEDD